MNLTAAAAQTMPTSRERAMALDLLDESPITHLTEDENPWFSDPVESAFPTPFFADGEQMWADEVLRDQMEGFGL